MPVPFQDSHALAPLGAVVAWLRFVEEEGGPDARACLFATSARGEPLEFVFARTARGGPFPASDGGAGNGAISFLAKSLFRATTASPALLFGLTEETPTAPFADDLNVGVPFCCICPAPPTGVASVEAFGGPHRWLFWTSGPPTPTSEAGQALDEIMGEAEPFEPFARAARALTEACADPRVLEMTGIPGLMTVITLPQSPERAGREAISDGAFEAAPGPVDGVPRGLARRLRAILAAPRRISPPNPELRLEWPGELMPFQRDGVRALLEMDRLLLSDDMGLGKTVQAIVALRILKARGDVRSCLVVAPASVLDQWRRELAKWAPELSAIIVRGSADDRVWQWRATTDVKLASYDVLRSDASLLSRLRVPESAWDAVVLDEAQRIKNRNDTSEAVKRLPRVRSWALTGTPVENDEEELASIMEFVDHDGKAPLPRYRAGPTLRHRHRELQLRRKKRDVLNDLPPKLETKLTIALHPDQRDGYDKAEREGIVYLNSLGADVGIQHVLELITRLKQICNVDPRTGASSKLDDIKDRLGTLAAQGHKALIFSQYISDTSGVAAAADYLREFNPLTLTGETPPEERSAIIDRFKAGDAHKAMIVSLRAGGLGLNLQEASYVFHLDRWWNPAVERQAEDRTHRLGQTVKVNVVKYACADTIEERIDRVLERKQALFDSLVDDVSLDLSARMNREELLGLFGLR